MVSSNRNVERWRWRYTKYLDVGFLSSFVYIWKASRAYFLLDMMAVSFPFGPYAFYACWLDFVLLLARQLNCSEHGLRRTRPTAFCVEVIGLPQIVNSYRSYGRIVVLI